MLSLTLVAIFVATIGFILWLGREKKPDGFKDIPGIEKIIVDNFLKIDRKCVVNVCITFWV